MSQGRHGVKIVGLSLLAALGLIAVTATVAQAGEFKVGGGTFTSKGIASESVKGISEGSPAFLVPSLSLEIVCNEATISGTFNLGGTGKETMLFTGCKIPNNKFCEVDPITAKFSSSVLLHGGETWILFTPQEAGKPFTTIYVLGKGCTFPEINDLSGAFVALVNSTESAKQLLEFKANETTNKLFGIGYFFGSEPAFLDISAIWEFSGLLAGKPWTAE